MTMITDGRYKASLEIIGVILLSILCVTVFAALYSLLHNPQVITINHPPLVPKREYHAGESLVYDLDYCKPQKYAEDFAEVHYVFNDGSTYPVPEVNITSLPPGCHIAKETVIVPKLPPGTYTLDVVRIYPTLFGKTVIRSTSNTFEIQ